MEHHHGNRVGWADGLRESAGIDPRVVLQGPHTQVGHNRHKRQHPYQEHVAEGICAAVQSVVSEAVADVAIAVDGNSCDIENGPDDTQAHQEATELAMQGAQAPPIVNYRRQSQGVRIHSPQQVCNCQAHHKHIP